MKNENFGDRVKEFRISKEMSMEDLAKAVDVSKSNVSMWENSNAIPRNDVLLKLAKLFGISTDYLLGKEVIWGIHNTENEKLLLDDNIIAIGWKEMGDLSTVSKDKKTYYDLYEKIYPQSPKQSIAVSASIIFRFVNESKIGDYVVYPSKFNRMVNIGQIEGEYFFNRKELEYPHQKKIKWLKEVPRETFSQGALYEMGAFLTFFKIKNNAEEIQAVLEKNENILDDNSYTFNNTAEAVLEDTKDYIIKSLKKNYIGYNLEVEISNLFNAMGYETQISTHQGERDIVVYKDGLLPRNIIRVNSQKEDITEGMLKSFESIIQEGDYGIFITLSNFSENAKKFLKNKPRIKALHRDLLANLILEHYDKMPKNFRETIKLRKIYIPVDAKEENVGAQNSAQ